MILQHKKREMVQLIYTLTTLSPWFNQKINHSCQLDPKIDIINTPMELGFYFPLSYKRI